MTKQRFIPVILAAVVGAGVLAAPAASTATAGGANNVVIAKTTGEAATSTHSHVKVSPVGGDTVGSANIALATSTDCTGCRTVAVAFQAVLITRDASTIIPGNVAAAANGGCFSCFTYAYAYQYVVSTDGVVRLSFEGQQRVHEIRRSVATVAAGGGSADGLTEELDALAAEFRDVIDSETIGVGHRSEEAKAIELRGDDGA
jgi:putative peptide zinc metalloprotease protein